MQAVVLESFGGPDVLVPGEVDDPAVEEGWAVVQLRAAALNWHDVLVRRGRYDSPLPHVIGADGAGMRRDTGERVVVLPSLWWGDREAAPGPNWEILGDRVRGTYAELVRVPSECVAPVPDGLDWHQAAALPLVGLTAFRALVTRGRLQAGDHLLVLGAGGGLATMAIALASAVGATVTVTSSTSEKIQGAVELGAAGGVLYTREDWIDAVRDRTPGGQGFDVVLDAVGTWHESLRTLRSGGRLVAVGATASEESLLSVRHLYFGQYDLLGSTMGSPRDFAGLLDLVRARPSVVPPVGGVWSLDAAADAHRAMESGDHRGKLVLET